MKTKILMLVVFLGWSTAIIAQPMYQGERRQFRGNDRAFQTENQKSPRGPMEGLNLTDAQKETFKNGMIAMQKEMKPLRNELGELTARQKTLVSADEPDMKAINKNLEKIGELKTQMAKIQVKHRLEMRSQLTEEQKLKFDMHKTKMRMNQGKANCGMPVRKRG